MHLANVDDSGRTDTFTLACVVLPLGVLISS